jgi:hypothetical protein
MIEPVSPLPWRKVRTTTSWQLRDANNNLVSYSENAEFIAALVETYQAHKADAEAVLRMKEDVDE